MIKASELASTPLVIYGAGKRAQAEVGILRGNGIFPSCFCDEDAGKWGSMYMGLPVMSIADIKRKYDDFRVYIAIAPPLKYEVGSHLIESGIFPRQWIVNHEDYRKHIGCWSLETVMIVNNGKLDYCCCLGNLHNVPPFVNWKESTEGTVDAFIEYRDRLVADLQNPEPPPTRVRVVRRS